MEKISIILIVFCLAACSPKLLPLEKTERAEKNSHLLYEEDSLANYLVYNGFVVAFNEKQKVPDYTIHKIVPQQLGDSNGIRAERSDQFFVDERIRNVSAVRADYYQSGYDRGHHVPAGDFVYSQTLKDETFTYANISPQLKELNRYGWRSLEAAIRKQVLKCNCDAYVVTGTLFDENHSIIGENRVGVPDQLYKIAFFPDKRRMYALLMDNSTAWYKGPLKRYQCSVDELESLSGYDFFERLHDKDEKELESKIKRLRE